MKLKIKVGDLVRCLGGIEGPPEVVGTGLVLESLRSVVIGKRRMRHGSKHSTESGIMGRSCTSLRTPTTERSG